MEAVSYVDELVKEYLLFRGFAGTLRSFDVERRNDKLKGFQVDRLVDQLFSYIQAFDIVGMQGLWSYLESHFFSNMDTHFLQSVKKLELSLLRYYCVHCIQNGKAEKVKDFFDSYAEQLHREEEWESWFVLPFIRSPELEPAFEAYFSKQWLEAFTVSLRNFLSTIFSSVSLPKILNFNVDRAERKALECELQALRGDVQRLRSELDSAESELREYRAKDPLRTIHGVSTSPSPKSARGIRVKRSTGSFPSPSKRKGIPLVTEAPPASAGDGGALWEEDPVNNGESIEMVAAAAVEEKEQDEPVSDDVVDTEEKAEVGRIPTLTGEEPFTIDSQDVFSGHTAGVNVCRFSADGANFASGSKDATVRVWSLGSHTATRNATIFCTSEVTSLDWDTKNDRFILFGTCDRNIKLWNVDSKRVICDMYTDGEFPRIVDLAFSPSDSVFVCSAGTLTSENSGKLTSWNLRTCTVETNFVLDPVPTQINTLRYNHNGNMLVTGGSDGMIRIFDMITCSPIMGWPAHDSEVTCVRFSCDETTIISAGADGKIVEWSLHNIRKILRSFDLHEYKSERVEIALDEEGQHFLVTSPFNQGVIYQLQSSVPIQTIGGHSGPVKTVDWQASMNMCLTGSTDHSVRVTRLIRKVSEPL